MDQNNGSSTLVAALLICGGVMLLAVGVRLKKRNLDGANDERTLGQRLGGFLIFLGPVCIGFGLTVLSWARREPALWTGVSSKPHLGILGSVGLVIAGAAAAVGGWRIVKKIEHKPRTAIDEGLGGTFDAIVGLAGYALLICGVIVCGMAFWLPFFLR